MVVEAGDALVAVPAVLGPLARGVDVAQMAATAFNDVAVKGPIELGLVRLVTLEPELTSFNF